MAYEIWGYAGRVGELTEEEYDTLRRDASRGLRMWVRRAARSVGSLLSGVYRWTDEFLRVTPRLAFWLGVLMLLSLPSTDAVDPDIALLALRSILLVAAMLGAFGAFMWAAVAEGDAGQGHRVDVAKEMMQRIRERFGCPTGDVLVIRAGGKELDGTAFEEYVMGQTVHGLEVVHF